MGLKHTWRWFGPADPVSLEDITQAGVYDIVSSINHIPIGEIWTIEDLKKRKKVIERNTSSEKPNLTWSVVESLPIHEDIKLGHPNRDKWIENYIESIRNIAGIGIKVICYNFMPVVDWTRTNLELVLQNGAKTLSFNIIDFIIFDVCILQRENSENDYPPNLIDKANKKFALMSDKQKLTLQQNIIAGLPGGHEGYSIESFKKKLNDYTEIDRPTFKNNLCYFLKNIIPVAEEVGVNFAIHPDDPPFSLFGLPRIVSNASDLSFILNCIDSVSNGFTLCTGSLAVLPENNMLGMIKSFGQKMNYVHLRNIKRDGSESFCETEHLYGDVNMFEVLLAILNEQNKRKLLNRNDWQIPMRADHGQTILDDLKKELNPGYSAIGLLKGTAELRGLEMGIEKSGLV